MDGKDYQRGRVGTDRDSAPIQDEEITIYRSDHKTRLQVSVSVSVHILANNALRAHHTSAHDGLTANVLSDICLTFFEMILLSCLSLCLYGRSFHSLAVVGKQNDVRVCWTSV